MGTVFKPGNEKQTVICNELYSACPPHCLGPFCREYTVILYRSFAQVRSYRQLWTGTGMTLFLLITVCWHGLPADLAGQSLRGFYSTMTSWFRLPWIPPPYTDGKHLSLEYHQLAISVLSIKSDSVFPCNTLDMPICSHSPFPLDFQNSTWHVCKNRSWKVQMHGEYAWSLPVITERERVQNASVTPGEKKGLNLSLLVWWVCVLNSCFASRAQRKRG